MTASKKIFIDCGFYKGGGISFFMKTYDYDESFKFYAFDPIPKIKKLKIANNVVDLTLIEKAVWLYDGEVDFHSSPYRRGKCDSIYSHDCDWGKKLEVKRSVPCIDFSSWLLNNFSASDHIVLKMDIESAEEKVLKKMDDDGALNLVDIFYLENHFARRKDHAFHVFLDGLCKKYSNVDFRGRIERAWINFASLSS